MVDDVVVVDVAGDLDLSSAPAVRSVILRHLDDGWTRFVVDLSNTSFIDSAGFGLLIGGRRRAREAGGGLELVAVDPGLLRTLTIAELDRIFEPHDSVADAIRRLDRRNSRERAS